MRSPTRSGCWRSAHRLQGHPHLGHRSRGFGVQRPVQLQRRGLRRWFQHRVQPYRRRRPERVGRRRVPERRRAAGPGFRDHDLRAEEFSFALPDPLLGLPAPPKPTTPTPTLKEWVGATRVDAPTNIPDYCPGAVAPKDPQEATPHLCVLGQGGAQANGSGSSVPACTRWARAKGWRHRVPVAGDLLDRWRRVPGVQRRVDHLGRRRDGHDEGNLPCDVPPTFSCTGGGGVLIYNSKLVNSAAGPITLGGGGAVLSLMPYDYPFGSRRSTL
jgi:hypothetical protein